MRNSISLKKQSWNWSGKRNEKETISEIKQRYKIETFSGNKVHKHDKKKRMFFNV